MKHPFLAYLTVALILLCIGIETNAQVRCGTMERWEMELEKNSELIHKRQEISKQLKRWKKSNTSNDSYIIPVVFHVLYENADENILSNQIMSQLEVLNQDFNRSNSDADQTPSEFQNLAANCNISFCLAQRTPNNDITSGITYTSTDISSFSLYDNRIFHDSLGGKNIWDPSKYLNIYICDLTNALGFASFPGGNTSRDAVVINYDNLGTINVSPPFNKGRTATHEVGHWLDLLHIWGGGSCGNDEVDDTPIQETENYGCPSHPSPSCSNAGDMFQNFMDYTNDECMNLFTNGQKNRMYATLNNQRQNFNNSIACSVPFEDLGINENISPLNNQEYCGAEVELVTSLFNYSNSTIYKAEIFYQIDNNQVESYKWNGNLDANSSIEIILGNYTLTSGQHTITIYSNSPNGFRDLNPINDTLNVNFVIKDGTNFEFDIQTDNYAEENRWEILNSQNEVIQFEDELVSNELNMFSFCQDKDSCYILVVYDEYNDGICCDFGNGQIIINNQFFNGDFDSQLTIDLCNVSTTKEHKPLLKNPNIYPNPTSGIITIESPINIKEVKVYNILGEIVTNKYCNNKLEQLNLQGIKYGTYIIQITSTEGINHFKKIILQ